MQPEIPVTTETTAGRPRYGSNNGASRRSMQHPETDQRASARGWEAYCRDVSKFTPTIA